MKTRIAVTCLIGAALLGPMAIYAADPGSIRMRRVTLAADTPTTIARVNAGLADEKTNGMAHVNADTDRKGAVILRGHVRTQEDAYKAVSIARAIEGVTSVKSRLHIRSDG